MTESKLILALDGISFPRAMELTAILGPRLYAVKVHELADRFGVQDICRHLKAEGAPRVWVDYKLHDTPDTVRNRAMALRDCGADILTVHVGDDGLDIIKAARESGAEIYAITVLTSVPDGMLKKRYGRTRVQVMLDRALDAQLAGANGVVCSAPDASEIKRIVNFDSMGIIIPGTRLPGGDHHDQKNVTTPEEAFRNGATKLVVGRDLTKADDPETVLAAYEAARQ